MNGTNKKMSFLKIQDLNVTLTSSYNSTQMKTTKRRQQRTTATQNIRGTMMRRQRCQNLFTETNINTKKMETATIEHHVSLAAPSSSAVVQ